MTIILAGNVITHLYLGLNAMLRSTNRPRMAMYATFGTVLINCILAPLFIFVLGWGIRGAATATVCAQTVMLLWQIRLFSNKSDFIHIERKLMRLRRKIVKESLLIGLPPFLINLCACLVAITVTRSMTQYGGDVSVGAFGIVNRLSLFVAMICIGLNQGMQPIAGYNFGARKYDRLMRVLKLAIIVATCITTTGFLIGTFFSVPAPPSLPRIRPSSSSGFARPACGVHDVPFVGMQIVSTAFFQSIGYAAKSILVSLSRQLLFLLPALLILPHFFSNPIMGVWYAMPLADGLACLFSGTLLIIEVKRFKRQPPRAFRVSSASVFLYQQNSVYGQQNLRNQHWPPAG